MINLKIKVAGVVLLAAAALSAGGCASSARVDAMQVSGSPEQRVKETPLRENLSVANVTGGKETNPMWMSQVSSDGFKDALEQSLKRVGLFAPGQLSKYNLVSDIEDIEQPMFGASLTVTARVRYSLYEKSSGKVIFEKTISVPYTASFTSSLLATERLRLANEGAVRANITELLNELFELQINNVALN